MKGIFRYEVICSAHRFHQLVVLVRSTPHRVIDDQLLIFKKKFFVEDSIHQAVLETASDCMGKGA